VSRVVRKPWTPGWLLEQGHLQGVGEFEGALYYAWQQWLEGHGQGSRSEHLGLSEHEVHCFMRNRFVGQAMTTKRLAEIARDVLDAQKQTYATPTLPKVTS
jgi:hypothetical protein